MTTRTLDGNEAVASVAHRASEVIAIYPITPSSSMAELCDEWSAADRSNVWGQTPRIIQMQSEAGVAGAVHGALQAGALATSFTSSQGLLLMIPNLYKIAGELTPFVLHVAARSIATHALSIFGDHSDVMACRQTGCAMLASGSVQEAHDMAAVAHAATLRTRIPFIHFFDGFRTSHQISKIQLLADEELRAMLDEDAIADHRARALDPDRPVIRGTAHNPDTFFQAREASNPWYEACAGIVRDEMKRLERFTGRRYGLVEYHGAPDADRVVVVMGSGGETLHEAVDFLNAAGAKTGVLKVRLYRPFPVEDFLAALPRTTRRLAVLDRTKEPGALGDPLYLDVLAALEGSGEAPEEARTRRRPQVFAGRYGLSSKEFDPAMAIAVFAELAKEKPRKRFTIGIVDDVGGSSLEWDRSLDLDFPDRFSAVFYGLGSDGTVGANKNAIKIIGETTGHDVQGYFVYDSKKSGAMTVSHLRFGPAPIRSPYLVKRADFVACHQWSLFDRVDPTELAKPGAVFLLNSPFADPWLKLPRAVQESILEKKLRLFTIDAEKVARESGMGSRINSVMQTCFFAISGVLPREQAIQKVKESIEKTYGKKGAEVVRRNQAAVDATLANLRELPSPTEPTAARLPVVSAMPELLAELLAGRGDLLPVSAFPPDGTWPTGTARFEKRNLADEIPVWDPDICIQCNKCSLICPHAAIRPKAYSSRELKNAPGSFKSAKLRQPLDSVDTYTLQVSAEDCTGCGLCVEICPVKDRKSPRHKAIDMAPQVFLRESERKNLEFFLGLPQPERAFISHDVRGSQFLEPLFEYSGACSGCGETPYLKLLTQLFGDRLVIANATGCSSIYGGNLPTTPWTKNAEGRGPAWSNSLFEDNAEFGLGMRLALDSRTDQARDLLVRLAPTVGDALASSILTTDQSTEADISAQRDRVAALRMRLSQVHTDDARRLETLASDLVRKSVWIIGGDGWAYDIGFGGLDHVLSTYHDVNILVLDTEVYSNTGGQQSKATPMGATAKFAAGGKVTGKKDLGLMAMNYGHVYIAHVAMGAKDAHTVRALQEAEAHPGPSLVIAYSHCIAHGYDLVHGVEQQRLAVDSGAWPLYRFDPKRVARGEPALKLDSGPPKIPLEEYLRNEDRFRAHDGMDARARRALLARAQEEVNRRWSVYEQLARVSVPATAPPEEDAVETAKLEGAK